VHSAQVAEGPAHQQLQQQQQQQQRQTTATAAAAEEPVDDDDEYVALRCSMSPIDVVPVFVSVCKPTADLAQLHRAKL